MNDRSLHTTDEHGSTPSVLNPVTLAVLTKRLEAVTTKMANTLLRTGRSGVLNLARDFSTSIVTHDSKLLTGSESLPIHFLKGADLMCQAMKELHPDLLRGDAFLHNSPYHGCSHAADLTILVPVIDDQGEHRFTLWVKAHQADIGNSQPTTYMGHARDVYEEGALIFPVVRVQKGYEDVSDIIRMCQMRIRVPMQWYGDYLAMVGAARIGEREILALAEEYGWQLLQDYAEAWFDYSERMMMSAIRQLPGGRSTAESTHDPLPGTPPEGVIVKVVVDVDNEHGLITVDLRNNPDVMPNGLNTSRACSLTGAMIGVFNSLPSPVPTNEGSFRRIKVLLREGCCIGGGAHPASMSASTTNLADRITNPVQVAFSRMKNGIGMAECGAHAPASMAVISGLDPRNRNEPFINQVYLFDTGGAAAPDTDAWLTICHAGNAGMHLIDSVELDELHFPIIVTTRRMLADTEGAGRTLGAPAGLCEYGPLGDSTLSVSFVADGHVNPAKGTRGGRDGSRNRNFLRMPNGELEEHFGVCFLTLTPGESVVAYTPGGGGYGSPCERPAAAVAADVREGWVTEKRAKEIYGVVLDKDGEVDPEATRHARNL